MKKEVPTLVYLLCKSGALIVGSLAEYLIGKRNMMCTDDYDLIVPPEKWHVVSLLIPKTAVINKHGGFRFNDEYNNEIDVWPSSIDEFLRHCKPGLGNKAYIIDYINSKVYTSYLIGTKNEESSRK